MATEAAELDAEQQALADEQAADADLLAGFDTPAPPETETKAPAAEVKTDDDGKPIETEVQTEAKTEEPKPEYVQLTKEEYGVLKAAADKTVEFGTKLDRLQGTFGNIKQIVDHLQSAKTAPAVVVKFKNMLAKTREDFPDLADRIEDDLEEAMKGLGGAAPTAADAEVLEVNIAKRIKEFRDAEQLEALNEAYPGWGDTVGKFGEKNEFRTWVAKRGTEYENRINNTRSALTIGRALDEFFAEKKKAAAVPPKKPPDRKIMAQADRIAGAVQPRGDGQPPPRRDNSEDEFLKGFNE